MTDPGKAEAWAQGFAVGYYHAAAGHVTATNPYEKANDPRDESLNTNATTPPTQDGEPT